MNSFAAAAGLVFAYLASIAIYRLYFSPLAKFPGPKLAALTTWYSAYYDLVAGGQYVWVIDEMHHKYGPIVRVRPDALHVNDPSFVNTLYTQSPKHRRERFTTILKMAMADGSMLGSRDHDLHRRRRAVLSPYFSQQNVRRLVPVINETLANLLRRMDGWAKEGQPVQLNRAYRAATKDVIQYYAFGGGEKCLDMEDCNAPLFDGLVPQRVCHLPIHFNWLNTLMKKTPPAIMNKILPRIVVFSEFLAGIADSIEEVKRAKDLPEGKTIFHEIIRSDIPESEKDSRRILDEAMVLIFAGSETTAGTLVALTYELLSRPAMLARLRAELETVMPNPNEYPDPAKLDGLPFLNALIEETLRFYPGGSLRQDRVAPDEDLVYERPDGKTFVIPRGTGVGMTAPLLNRHPDLYRNPNEFRPDRFIEDPKLFKHTFSFSKGGRQCLGMNLAYQELQTFTASIFRKYDVYDPSKKVQNGPTMELFETKAADVGMHADYITPAPYEGSPGLRVIIRE